MTKLFMRRQGRTFIPGSELWAEELEKAKEGELVEVNYYRRRNIKHHDLYWGLMAFLAEQQDTWPTARKISNRILDALGYSETYDETDFEGKPYKVVVVDSISFAAMGQDEFDELWKRIVFLVCDRIIPNLDEGIAEEALRMLNPTEKRH